MIGKTNSSSTNGRVYYLGTGSSFNIKSKFPTLYGSLTADNFICTPATTSFSNYTGFWHTDNENYFAGGNFAISKTYDAANGILKSSSSGKYYVGDRGVSDKSKTGTITGTVNAYLVIGNIETA